MAAKKVSRASKKFTRRFILGLIFGIASLSLLGIFAGKNIRGQTDFLFLDLAAFAFSLFLFFAWLFFEEANSEPKDKDEDEDEDKPKLKDEERTWLITRQMGATVCGWILLFIVILFVILLFLFNGKIDISSDTQTTMWLTGMLLLGPVIALTIQFIVRKVCDQCKQFLLRIKGLGAIEKKTQDFLNRLEKKESEINHWLWFIEVDFLIFIFLSVLLFIVVWVSPKRRRWISLIIATEWV